MLGLAVALTSCSEDKYEPATASPGAYFVQGQKTVISIDPDGSTFSIPVMRTQDAGTSFTIQAFDESGAFSVPASITFSGNETLTDLVITYDNKKLEQDVPYELSLAIQGETNVGRSTINLSVTMQLPAVTQAWADGYGTYTYYGIFSGDDPDLPITLSYLPSDPNRYTWSISDWGGGTDMTITCDDYTNIDAYGTVTVHVPVQEVGLVDDQWGTLYVADLYNFFLYNMGDAASANAVEDYSFYDPETGKFYLYTIYWGSNQEPGYYIGTNTYEYFQCEGFPDNSISVTYDGFFTDRNENMMVKSTIQCGADVANVKAIMIEGNDPDQGVNAILSDADGVQEFKAASTISADFELSVGGQYTIVAVAYDNKGEAVTTDSDTFEITLGADPDAAFWKDLGMADYADGWVVPAFINSETNQGLEPLDYAYSVALQQYIGQDEVEGTLYRLVNAYAENPLTLWGYNAYKAKRNIQYNILGENVGIKPQPCGFGASNWGGEMTIGNVEGMYMDEYGLSLEDVVSVIVEAGNSHFLSIYEDYVVEVPLPLFGRPSSNNGEFGYNWQDYKAAYIFMPEVDAAVRAKVKARNVAAHKVKGLAQKAVARKALNTKIDGKKARKQATKKAHSIKSATIIKNNSLRKARR